jgi:hypothetical protein
MSDVSGIKVEGLDELIRAFAKLPDEAINTLKPAIKNDTKIILTKARANLVKHNKTGAMSKSLKTNAPKRAKKYKYQIFASVYFAMEGRHGVPLELGHSIRNRKNGPVYGHVSERPFLRPAADESRTQVISDVMDAMNSALDQWGR